MEISARSRGSIAVVFARFLNDVGIYQGSSYPSFASNYRGEMNRAARSIVWGKNSRVEIYQFSQDVAAP